MPGRAGPRSLGPKLRAGRAACATAAAAALIGLGLVGNRTSASMAQAPTATPTPSAPLCDFHFDKTASPGVVLLGETVTVTLTVLATCRSNQPLHVVLVLDGSGSMAGEPSQTMKAAATRLIELLDLAYQPDRRIGVVQFNSAATRLCELTNDPQRAKGCVRHVAANGGSAIDTGIREGMEVLIRGRSATSARELMMLFSDGGNNAGCPPVLAAANQVKGMGVLLATVCVGTGCDVACVRQAATSPRYYSAVQSASGLSGVFDQVLDQVLDVGVRKLTVVDKLAEGIRYVPNSARPDTVELSPAGDQLTWQTVNVPKEGVTYTFRAEPRLAGSRPISMRATGEHVDRLGRKGSFDFPMPHVTVLMPSHLMTPVPAPPTPTHTPLPPTPTGGPPSATPTATAMPKTLWLPKLDRS